MRQTPTQITFGTYNGQQSFGCTIYAQNNEVGNQVDYYLWSPTFGEVSLSLAAGTPR